MAASNVTITRKTDGASVSIPAYKLFDALKYSSRYRPEDDSIEIDSVRYIRSSVDYSSATSGTFANATWDVSTVAGGIALLNEFPAGVSIQDTEIQNKTGGVQAFLGRSGYTGTPTVAITDSNGLFVPGFTATDTIAANSSMAMARLATKATVLPGTYTVAFACSDGSAIKSRIFNIIVSAYPTVPPGNGWL